MFSSGDYFAMIGMAFALLMTLVIGGFILLFPIARRLGQAVEEWIRIRRRETASEVPGADSARLVRSLESLQGDVDRLIQRQEFVESLLERERGELDDPDPKRMAAGAETERPRPLTPTGA